MTQDYPHYPPPVAAPVAPPNPYEARVHYSGLAIAAMVLGILGWLYLIPAILAVVFGHIALSKIKASNGWVTGRGMAIAGLVLGYVWLGVFALLFLVALTGDDSGTGTYN